MEILNTVRDAFKSLNDNTTLYIGLPLTPATIEKVYVNVVSKILITYGGGMGGAHKIIYSSGIIGDNMLKNTDHISIKTLDGEHIVIYTKYIVTIQNVRVITLVGVHDNHNFKKKHFLTQTEIGVDNSYEIVGEYISDDKRDGTLIKKIFY